MPSFLNGNQISYLTGLFQNLFETMSTGRGSYVTVVKEPVQNIANVSNDILSAYGPDINNVDVTYTPVTGVFPAIVIYPYKNMPLDKFVTLKFQTDLNAVYVKVQEEAKNFIMNGKTERMIADGLTYIPQDYTPQVQNYFGSRYYYFKLNSTQ